MFHARDNDGGPGNTRRGRNCRRRGGGTIAEVTFRAILPSGLTRRPPYRFRVNFKSEVDIFVTLSFLWNPETMAVSHRSSSRGRELYSPP
jgi:hypothetical protein